jgi:hypothetical protein
LFFFFQIKSGGVRFLSQVKDKYNFQGFWENKRAREASDNSTGDKGIKRCRVKKEAEAAPSLSPNFPTSGGTAADTSTAPAAASSGPAAADASAAAAAAAYYQFSLWYMQQALSPPANITADTTSSSSSAAPPGASYSSISSAPSSSFSSAQPAQSFPGLPQGGAAYNMRNAVSQLQPPRLQALQQIFWFYFFLSACSRFFFFSFIS